MKTPSTDALVSVIIPCYNQSRFLAQSIESVLHQSYEPKEIVVVDDGSTDATAAVAARYHVRYVHQRNAGLAHARNRGIRESSGAFLVFLDADDRLLPGALEAGLACFRAHPECAFVFGGFRHIDVNGSPVPLRFTPDEPGLYLTLLHYNHIGCPAAVMYRHGIFDDVGGFDGAFNPAEDYELYLRIARTFPIRRHAFCVAEYRKYDGTMSSDAGRMLSSIMRLLRAQERHVRSDTERRRALEQGLKGNRDHYVELLRIQSRDARQLAWRRRLRLAKDLLRWDASGLVKTFAPGAYCAAFRVADAIRNALIKVGSSGEVGSGTIAADPNPIRTPSAQWDGPASTSIAWESAGAADVEIHVDRPDGPLFSASSPSGRASTGEWVRDGTRFYLQAVSATDPRSSRTLAVITVNIVPE